MSEQSPNVWEGIDKAARYIEAVDYARVLFERDARSEHFLNAFLDWDSAIEQWSKLQTDSLTVTWVRDKSKSQEEKAKEIIGRSLLDPLGFHVARNVVAGMIERGDEIPTILRVWAAAVLRGVIQSPDRRGKPEISHKLWFIVLAGRVKMVASEFDLHPLKSPYRSVRTGEAYCACDAVVDGWMAFLKSLPKDRRKEFPTLSYSTVRNAYSTYKTKSKIF